MKSYLELPFLFLKFWYYDAPKNILAYISSLNFAFLELFSLPLFIKTYFQPWKNEYRKGLVGFSIGMGMFIKTFFIAVDTMIFVLLLSTEVFFFALFLTLPIITIWVLLIR